MKTRQARIRCRTWWPYCAVLVALALTFAILPSQAAQNALEAHLQVLDDEIATHEALLKEIDRQAKERVTELHAWIEFWSSVRDLAAEQANTLRKDFDQRIQGMERALTTLQSITLKQDEQRHLPNYGWHSVVGFSDYMRRVREEYQGIQKLIADGKENWHYAALGWLTSEYIDDKIESLQEEQRKIQQGVQEGSYQIHYPGRGWTGGAWPRQRIAEIEREKQAIRDQVTKGEYSVHIPGLGWRTRNSLEADIKRVEQAIENLKVTAYKGELALHRPAIGWRNRQQLEDDLAKGAEAFEVMKKTVGDGLYTVWINAEGAGWRNLVEIEKQLEGMDEKLAEAQAAIQAGTYVAQTPVGWVSQQEIEKMLDAEAENLRQPDLKAERRQQIQERIEALRKSLTDWHKLSAMDIAIKGLEKTRVGAWVALPLKLARPDFERRQIIRNEQEAHRGDFEGELRAALQPYELELARLKAAQAWIPSG